MTAVIKRSATSAQLLVKYLNSQSQGRYFFRHVDMLNFKVSIIKGKLQPR